MCKPLSIAALLLLQWLREAGLLLAAAVLASQQCTWQHWCGAQTAEDEDGRGEKDLKHRQRSEKKWSELLRTVDIDNITIRAGPFH